jgi:cytoskeletal protein RodZ
MLDDIDLEIPDKKPPKRSGNQSFRLIAGILAVVLLLALIAAAIYAFIILPGQAPAADLPQSAVDAGLTETAEALAGQDEGSQDDAASPSPTATRTATAPPATLAPTATEITPIFTAAVNGQTATVNALLTQAAIAQTEAAGGTVATATSVPSALPDSGFADDVGLPTLLIATALLLAVILLARRMRAV